MLNVLVLAAYASVRAGLRAMLEHGECIASVVESSIGSGTESPLASMRPDVIVYDVNESNWGTVLEEARVSDCAIVILGEDPSIGRATLETPARGTAWLRKDVEQDELLSAVHAVATGLVVLDTTTARSIGVVSREDPSGPRELSSREHQVLQLMSEGLPNKQIAQRLGISGSTAKFHVASVLAKLDASSRTEAVTTGVRLGLVAV